MNLQKSKPMFFPEEEIINETNEHYNIPNVINETIINSEINVNQIINNKIFIIEINKINLPHNIICSGKEIILYNNLTSDIEINGNIIVKPKMSLKLIYSEIINKWI